MWMCFVYCFEYSMFSCVVGFEYWFCFSWIFEWLIFVEFIFFCELQMEEAVRGFLTMGDAANHQRLLEYVEQLKRSPDGWQQCVSAITGDMYVS